MLYCFLDTNIFLEFRPIEEIKWLKELNTSSVCLVVTSVVVRELDKHKAGNNNRLRKRARKSISFLKTLDSQADNDLRTNVTLRFDLTEPKRHALDEYNLSADVNDDLLVAKAIEFRGLNKTAMVAILTDDAVVQFKAEGYGLGAPELSEDLKSPHEIDPLVKENRELRIENARLQNNQPKLQLGFRDSAGNLVSFLHASKDFALRLISEAELDDLIQTERDKLQYVREEQPIENDRLSAFAELASFRKVVTNGQIDDYYRKIEEYLEHYRKHLLDKSFAYVFPYRSIELSFVLKNEGSNPAQNVEIRLDVVGSAEEIIHVPEVPPYEPSPPAKPEPRSPFDINSYIPGILPTFNYGIGVEDVGFGRPWDEWTKEIDHSGAARYEYGIKKLSHHRNTDLEPFYLMIDESQEFPATVQVEYEVTADNMVDMLNGTLTVIVNKDPSCDPCTPPASST